MAPVPMLAVITAAASGSAVGNSIKPMTVLLYIILPIANFYFWFRYATASAHINSKCPSTVTITALTATSPKWESEALRYRPCPTWGNRTYQVPLSEMSTTQLQLPAVPQCGLDQPPSVSAHMSLDQYRLELVPARMAAIFRGDHLVSLRYPSHTVILNSHTQQAPCESLVTHLLASKPGVCFGVVSAHVPYTLPAIRFDSRSTGKYKDVNTTQPDGSILPTGSVVQVGTEYGRKKMAENGKLLFEHLVEIETAVLELLVRSHFLPGRTSVPIVTMVVNEGELDMLLNFICSCHVNKIDTSNMLVFVGSADIVGVVESMGCMAIYHRHFAAVSAQASEQYLDFVFSEMMWYKAFAVWILLKLRYDILFQDVDLIWFKEPYSHIDSFFESHGNRSTDSTRSSDMHEGPSRPQSPPDGVFSDDGQRGYRYSPFYANTGFYYLTANERTEYFAWSVLTAYDSLQVSGSHQNVFNMRLAEAVDLVGLNPKMLNLNTFPSGIKYHHDGPFMQGIKDRHEKPVMFHMCWTSNKADKIRYLNRALWWYSYDQLVKQEAINGPADVRMADSGTTNKKAASSAEGAHCSIPMLKAYYGSGREKTLLQDCCFDPHNNMK
jgi:Nucleotide-diphospho-sugar transferase